MSGRCICRVYGQWLLDITCCDATRVQEVRDHQAKQGFRQIAHLIVVAIDLSSFPASHCQACVAHVVLCTISNLSSHACIPQRLLHVVLHVRGAFRGPVDAMALAPSELELVIPMIRYDKIRTLHFIPFHLTDVSHACRLHGTSDSNKYIRCSYVVRSRTSGRSLLCESLLDLSRSGTVRSASLLLAALISLPWTPMHETDSLI
jgi:hypothetical protein